MEPSSFTGVRLGCDLVGFDGDVPALLLSLRTLLRASCEVAEVELPAPTGELPAFVVEVHFDRPLGSLDGDLVVRSVAEGTDLLRTAAVMLGAVPDDGSSLVPGGWRLRVRSVEVTPVEACPSGPRVPVLPWRMVSSEPLDDAESEVALGVLPDMTPLQVAAGAIAFSMDKEARTWPEDRTGHWRRIYQSRFLWRAQDPVGEAAALAELLVTLVEDSGERPSPAALVRYVESVGGTPALRAVLARSR